jgi:hypothetical protein
MTEADSVFVVFRKLAKHKGNSTPKPQWQELFCLNKNWVVTFDPQWGSQEPVKFDTLLPWNEHTDEAIKYFSGTAVYQTTFEYQKSDDDYQIVLNLGKVYIIAHVKLNGKDLGLLWKPPFRIDITNAVKRGHNELEIEVTNLWPNRLIGDEQYPEIADRQADRRGRRYLTTIPEWVQFGQSMPPTKRKTFSFCEYWNKDDKPLESGLLGPVRLLGNSRTTENQ